MTFSIIIPARMASTRLPRKMVADVVGLPLIVRVAKQALKSKAKQVVVATDHEEIYALCLKHKLNVVMTSPDHQSGTDRISEAVQLLGLSGSTDEVIINVQGDEPLIEPELINQLARFIQEQQTVIATIAHPLTNIDEVFNHNVVKTVISQNNLALYFSRAPIPYYRDGYSQASQMRLPEQLNVLRHIGIYAYRVGFLEAYRNLPISALEEVEALEQLRALYNGYAIGVMVTDQAPAAGVDTVADLVRVRQIIANAQQV